MAHAFKIGNKVIMNNGMRGTIRRFVGDKAVVETNTGPSTFYTTTLHDLIDVTPSSLPEEKYVSTGKPDSIESHSVESIPETPWPLPTDWAFFIDPPFNVEKRSDPADDGPEVEILKSVGYGLSYFDAEPVFRAIDRRRRAERARS
jgi:hypothetical protein